jgi:hypothetical protein
MKRPVLFLLVLAAGGFIFGVVHLFNLRFKAGDVYPKYSSFRADPLGAKAFFESLQRLVPTSRHLERWSKLGEGRATTLLYLGAEPDNLKFHKHELQNLETFVGSGGRLVISFVAQYKKRPVTRPGAAPEESLIAGEDRWGFNFQHAHLAKTNDQYQHARARRAGEDPLLPAEMVWHSGIYFDNLHGAWKVVYAISNDLPVLIERSFGDGQIVLCTDAYLFSNEALLGERHASLLSWVIGPARRVLFDETHLGVREEPGLATLFRRYRLHTLMAALLFVALLFIWKSSDTLVPRLDDLQPAAAAAVTGRGAGAGFVNLLRRNISRVELINVCIEQWKRTGTQRVSRARLERIQAVIDAENQLPAARRDPIRIYRALAKVISSRSLS